MPENAIYLQAAFAITILSLAVYVGYVLLRFRQAQDELRAARDLQRAGRAAPTAAQGQQLRSAQEPPAPR